TCTESKYTEPEALGYHKDGRQIPLEMSFSPLETPEGLLIINTVRDCSDKIKRDRRRVTRQAVRRALAEAGTLAEAAPGLLETTCENLEWDFAVLWTLDRQTRQLRALHSWHTVLGRDLESQL